MPAPVCHVEIPVRNMARAKKFYRALFGWAFKQFSPRYVMFDTGVRPGGALVKIDGPIGGDHATVYLRVDSIGETLRAAKAFGVDVPTKKSEIGGEGAFIAHLRDTEGNKIGLFEEVTAELA
ncbi:MAG: VOC family protein [Candidatus Brocadiae bacterium]|nr:VOC family protein [Candidatus Brocadiia bacterium]